MVFKISVKLENYEAKDLLVQADSEHAAKQHIADLGGKALLDALKLPGEQYAGTRTIQACAQLG